jgi:hypothetical protein
MCVNGGSFRSNFHQKLTSLYIRRQGPEGTSTENESYKKIPKSTVIRELNDGSLIKWQNEWDKATKGQTTKDFFPVIQDRLKLKIKITPIFTTMTTGHGNLKSYLHRF